jgi:hypothetical protein
MSTTPPSPEDFPPGYLEEDNGGRVIAAVTTMLVIATILYALRLYARSLTKAPRGWDDHVLIPAYIFFLGLVSCMYAEVTLGGLGRHTAAVIMEDPQMVSTFLMLLYILDWFYVPSNMLSRLSVVILYLRVFTDKWARRACWAVVAFLVLNCLSTIIAASLECTPLSYAWDRSIPGGHCFNQLLWYQLTNFPNIAADLFIMALPIKTVWSIKASSARKAGIAAVCLTGSIGIIASCVRTSVFYLQADVIANDPTFPDEAFSWTAVECGMYFSAACLIGMRPLFARLPSWIRDRILDSADDSRLHINTASRRKNTFHDYYGGNPGKYSGIHGDELEMGHQSDEIPLPLAAAGTGRQNGLQPYRGDPNDIRIQTDISVKFDREYP